MEYNYWRSLALGLRTNQALANACHTCLLRMTSLCWRHLTVEAQPSSGWLCLKLLTINQLSGSVVIQRTQGLFGTGSRSLPRCWKVGKHTSTVQLYCGMNYKTSHSWVPYVNRNQIILLKIISSKSTIMEISFFQAGINWGVNKTLNIGIWNQYDSSNDCTFYFNKQWITNICISFYICLSLNH